jgi:phosphatidylglycerophosphate synthase
VLDRKVMVWIKPVIDRIAQLAARQGLSATALTFLGFGLGLSAALAITLSYFAVGLGLILVSRLCDALDGAVARLDQPTDRGGFLDIALDFLFYASIPLAFAFSNPVQNALPAACLLASFLGTGTSFLAFAVLAAKRHMTSNEHPNKSFYFLGGLTEATETLLFFAAMCLWPNHFGGLAYAFSVLCLMTIFSRLIWGWKAFSDRPSV